MCIIFRSIHQIEGIVKIHDLHVWRLQPDCIIGTVHLRIRGLRKSISYPVPIFEGIVVQSNP